MGSKKQTHKIKRRGTTDSKEILTQDEVVLCQLGIPDLFVEGAAGVHVYVSHEAAVVEFLLHLTHKQGGKTVKNSIVCDIFAVRLNVRKATISNFTAR